MYITLLDGPFIVATPPVPYPFPSPLGPLAWLQGVSGSLSTPLASSPCAAAPSRSIWRLFGSTRARVSPGLGLAPALWLGYVFPLRAECLFVFQPHLLTNPPIFWRTVSPLASPCACVVGTCLSGRRPKCLPQCVGSCCMRSQCPALSWGLCLRALVASLTGRRSGAISPST
jgi:hypothetical protein